MLTTGALSVLVDARGIVGRFVLDAERNGYSHLLVNFTTDTGTDVALRIGPVWMYAAELEIKLDGQRYEENRSHNGVRFTVDEFANVSAINHPRVAAIVDEAIKELEQAAIRLDSEHHRERQESERRADEEQRRRLDRL